MIFTTAKGSPSFIGGTHQYIDLLVASPFGSAPESLPVFYPESARRAQLVHQPPGSPHGDRRAPRAATPSRIAARCHALCRAGVAAGGAAVSARKRSIAVAIAAASPSEGSGVIISIRGLGGRRLPSLPIARHCSRFITGRDADTIRVPAALVRLLP
jgi:hypothetical protein